MLRSLHDLEIEQNLAMNFEGRKEGSLLKSRR